MDKQLTDFINQNDYKSFDDLISKCNDTDIDLIEGCIAGNERKDDDFNKNFRVILDKWIKDHVKSAISNNDERMFKKLFRYDKFGFDIETLGEYAVKAKAKSILLDIHVTFSDNDTALYWLKVAIDNQDLEMVDFILGDGIAYVTSDEVQQTFHLSNVDIMICVIGYYADAFMIDRNILMPLFESKKSDDIIMKIVRYIMEIFPSDNSNNDNVYYREYIKGFVDAAGETKRIGIFEELIQYYPQQVIDACILHNIDIFDQVDKEHYEYIALKTMDFTIPIKDKSYNQRICLRYLEYASNDTKNMIYVSASRLGLIDILKEIKVNFDVNQRAFDIVPGSIECVKYLESLDALTTTDNMLIGAINLKCPEIVRYFLDQYVIKEKKSYNNECMFAIGIENIEIVRMLLETKKVDITIGIMLRAGSTRNIDIIKTVIFYGANPNIIFSDRVMKDDNDTATQMVLKCGISKDLINWWKQYTTNNDRMDITP